MRRRFGEFGREKVAAAFGYDTLVIALGATTNDAGVPGVREHTFPLRTFDEAIALHNAVPQGLSSAIFTTDVREAEAFMSAAGSDCGIANVNIGTSGAEIGGAESDFVAGELPAIQQLGIQRARYAALRMQMAQGGIDQCLHRHQRCGDAAEIGTGATRDQRGDALFDGLVHGNSSTAIRTTG